MSDVPEGEGETSFPSLSLKIQPKRNQLLMWPNFLSKDEIDPRVVHSGEIIKNDLEKIGINIWIHGSELNDDDDPKDEDYEEEIVSLE